MGWTKADLADALRAYRVGLEARPLAQLTVESHHRYAGFFVRWLYGDYTPRGAAPRADIVPATRQLNAADLRVQLDAYGPYLLSAGLKPLGVSTYVEGARLFAKWLDPSIVTKRPSLHAPPVRTAPSAPRLVADAPRDEQPGGWPSETFVQASLVAWLATTGWRIERVAHTGTREHGVDVLASRDGIRLMAEAKGYPASVYTTGERAGQPRKWHPASQARTYFGDALLSVLARRDSEPEDVVMLALPEVPGYRGLLAKVQSSLAALRVRTVFIAADGSVSEAPSAP